MGGDTRVRQSQKTFRGHSLDFQGIKFLRLQVRQDSLDCSAYRLLPVKTEYGCPEFTSQKKVHPASWIFRPNPSPSRFLTNLHPVAQGSLSNRSASGKNVPSLIRIVPALIVSAIWDLLGVYSDPLFRSNWRRQPDVCVGFELCYLSSFIPQSSQRFSLEGH